MSRPIEGLINTLFSQYRPLMALQVSYPAPNSQPMKCPSHVTMCKTPSRFYGLSLGVLSDRPAWTSQRGPGNGLYGLRRMVKK